MSTAQTVAILNAWREEKGLPGRFRPASLSTLNPEFIESITDSFMNEYQTELWLQGQDRRNEAIAEAVYDAREEAAEAGETDEA